MSVYLSESVWLSGRVRAKGFAAFLAGTNRSQVVVAVNACGMPIGKVDLHGVIPNGFGCASCQTRLEHRQNGAAADGAARVRCHSLLLQSLVIAHRAWTLLSEVDEIVMAGVMVSPDDIDAGAG